MPELCYTFSMILRAQIPKPPPDPPPEPVQPPANGDGENIPIEPPPGFPPGPPYDIPPEPPPPAA